MTKGFAELYKRKPNFPIEYLGKWLKNYSRGQERQRELEATKLDKETKVNEMEQEKVEQAKQK